MPTYRLGDIYREVTHLARGGTSLQYIHRDGLTAYGDAAPLTVGQDVPRHITDEATYVYRGGYVHETTDEAVRTIWLASGFEVETIPDV